MNIATPAFAFVPAIAAAELQHLVPAAFSEHAAERTGRNYVFISTRELVDALLDAGFAAIRARQGNARKGCDSAYARHMLCFQPLRHSVSLDDAIPQIVLINSHDGRCAYQLRAGLYRPVCTNGLLTRIGDFGLIHVPHRGNVVRNVVEAALGMVREFGGVCDTVERMRRTALDLADRLQFARRALALRYVNEEPLSDRPGIAAGSAQDRRRGVRPLADAQRSSGTRYPGRYCWALRERPDDPLTRNPRDPRGRASQQRPVADRPVDDQGLIDYRVAATLGEGGGHSLPGSQHVGWNRRTARVPPQAITSFSRSRPCARASRPVLGESPAASLDRCAAT